MNGGYRNTRLSASISLTCQLSLTLKSSYKCSLTRGQLSHTGLSMCGPFFPCFEVHMQGVYTRMGSHSDHSGKIKESLVNIG